MMLAARIQLEHQVREISPNTHLSHYKILSKLGAGGMGEVYLAQDTSELGRTVALKLLPSELASNKDRLQRFTQEARTVSNLNHPNILTVYEFGQTESAGFIATEYIDGVTLRDAQEGRLTAVTVLCGIIIEVQIESKTPARYRSTHTDNLLWTKLERLQRVLAEVQNCCYQLR